MIPRPPDAHQRVPVGSQVLPRPPVASVERTGTVGRSGKVERDSRRFGRRARLPRTAGRRRILPSPPSRPTCGPSRRLLVLLPQQQLDALSDEGRGVPYFVYGASLLIQSHVASSRRKVTTRGFRIIRLLAPESDQTSTVLSIDGWDRVGRVFMNA